MSSADEAKEKKEKGKSTAKKVIGGVLNGLWVSVLSVVAAFSGQVIYNAVNYSSFYVNGESMYPTFNEHVEYEGKWKPLPDQSAWGDFTRPGEYTCDYGLMDSKEGFTARFKRFDIAVTYFPKDFDPEGKVVQGASLKIKRIIGMPGDSVYFDLSGNLFVKSPEDSDYQKVDQPFRTHMIERSAYRNAYNILPYGTIDHPISLGSDEWFLCGDNRNYSASDDSRFIGAVTSSCMTGRAVALTGRCIYTVYDDGTVSSEYAWYKSKLPWGYIKL